ncbi:MAG: response regulator transcription factor [Treponemataceae bacterium]
MGARVLIADDERKIAEMTGRYLEASGYEVVLAFDGFSALRLWKELTPDCLILDINMPLMDGLDVAREIRKTSSVPIIFLSARTDETDRVVGLELGADDYVSKPFSPRELVARVKAVLRRSRHPTSEERLGTTLRAGAVELDPVKRIVRVSGQIVDLTAIQFDILALLIREPGRVFSRLAILEAVSGTDFEGYERTIDAHVKNIRKALGDDGDDPKLIGTVRGVGYKFIEQGNDA